MGNIIIMGPIGCGKGTHSEYLSREYGYTHISTGDLCRAEIKRGTLLGQEIEALTRKGQFVSDATALGMLERALAIDHNILDGFPRNLAQVHMLDVFLAATGRSISRVLAFDIPEEVAILRLGGRRHCPECKAQYGLARLPRLPNYCDNHPAEKPVALAKRADDEDAVIRTRWVKYKQETEPIVDVYRQRLTRDGRPLLVRIDTTPPLPELKPKVLDALGLNGKAH